MRRKYPSWRRRKDGNQEAVSENSQKSEETPSSPTPLKPKDGSIQVLFSPSQRHSTQHSLGESFSAPTSSFDGPPSSNSRSSVTSRPVGYPSPFTPQAQHSSPRFVNPKDTLVAGTESDHSDIPYEKKQAPGSDSRKSRTRTTCGPTLTTRITRSSDLHNSSSAPPSQSPLPKSEGSQRRLRPRSTFQPYTKVREDRKRQDHGKAPRAREYGGGVQSGTIPTSSKFPAKVRDQSKSNAKSKSLATSCPTRRTSLSDGSTLASTPLTDDEKYRATTIYVTLASSEEGDEDNIPIALYLSDYLTCQALFDGLSEIFSLGAQERLSIIVNFPWREMHNHKIRLMRTLESSFAKVREEVRDAPCWEELRREGRAEKCEIQMEVNVRKQ